MADLELFSRDGALWDQKGTRVSLKGINWFGLETDDFALHGLWGRNMGALLDFVAAAGFNSLRVPFSAELALNMDGKRPGNIDYGANPELEGLTTGQVMDRLIEGCAARGLLVMLDMHRLAAAKDIPELWYDDEYDEGRVLTAWKTIIARYKGCWNVVAADLKNEPHGRASWGSSQTDTDWQLAAQRIGKVVQEANPKLLIFVEGVSSNACVQPPEPCWWGGHVAACEKAPVVLPVPDKLVYSPHVYGPDVFAQPYFKPPDFPSNMPDIWERHFGFVVSRRLGPAVCPGEWGGRAREGLPDKVWHEALASWFVATGIESSFYWCLNPNSGDTGGILQDDWVTPHQHKLDLIALAHPNPTRFLARVPVPIMPVVDGPAMADLQLFSRDGALWDQKGTRISLKGINWFGLETDDFALHGLWARNMGALLDFVAAAGFNALRVPFSAELALDMDGKRPGNIDYGANPELAGLTTGQVMDRLIEGCAARGLLVMLDMHRLAAAGGITELWYDDEYDEGRVLTAWKTIIARYKGCWNVVAADLKNEPHGRASWGSSQTDTDWQLAAQRIGKVVQEANPKLLIFVEGVSSNACVQPPEPCWWGGHVAACEQAPVVLPLPDKLVYSPHVYGPDVFAQPYFEPPDFPSNMPDIWERHFGFVVSRRLGPAVCPGEWGGRARAGSRDEVWHKALASWFVATGIESSYYWCLNPNSGDTGGILQDDWVTPHQHKLDLIALAHPNPTRFPAGVAVAITPA